MYSKIEYMERKLYLYVKENPLGLKYLGVTVRNPYKYGGSGYYWRNHNRKHCFSSSDMKTTILLETYSFEELKKAGLYYSELWNIVKSDEWANLKVEEGDIGTIGRIPSEETRKKISEANKGRRASKKAAEVLRRLNLGKTGFKHSEESKKKMSESAVGRKHTEETKQKISDKNKGRDASYNYKKVYQYSLEGIFIKEWDSVTEASNITNILICDISSCCLKNKHAAGKFQWRYEKFEKINSFSYEQNNINKSKSIIQYDKQMNFIKEWNGTKEPSEKLNIHRSGIRNCLVGLAPSAGGFVWKYTKEHEKEKQ